MCQNFLSFSGWVTFRYTYHSSLIQSCVEGHGFLPPFGYCEQNCYEHRRTTLPPRLSILPAMYTQKWNCWITWESILNFSKKDCCPYHLLHLHSHQRPRAAGFSTSLLTLSGGRTAYNWNLSCTLALPDMIYWYIYIHHGVAKSQTRLSDWTELILWSRFCLCLSFFPTVLENKDSVFHTVRSPVLSPGRVYGRT